MSVEVDVCVGLVAEATISLYKIKAVAVDDKDSRLSRTFRDPAQSGTGRSLPLQTPPPKRLVPSLRGIR